jgi:uncharacterized membrane protein YhaH (DUF805 family)
MPAPDPYRPPRATLEHLRPKEERGWGWVLFSFEGRISRGRYWSALTLSSLPVLILLGVAVYNLALAMDDGYIETTSFHVEGVDALVLWTLGMAAMVPLLWMNLAVTVKRWHDRNKSGAWLLIGLIPYIGALWSMIELGFLRGTEGPNTYGPDPLNP